jgi:hypothetical protein
MGLFNFSRKNNSTVQKEENVTSNGDKQNEIPREVFIDESEPRESSSMNKIKDDSMSIIAIYDFLLADYSIRGYNDALESQDQHHLKQNIEVLKGELRIKMEKVLHHLKNKIEQLECGIKLTEDHLLLNKADELKSMKKMLEEEIAKIHEIKKDMEENSGLFKHVMESYEVGFKRGLTQVINSKYKQNS